METLRSAGRLVLLIVLFHPALKSQAAIDWTNRSGGSWSNPINWFPQQVPGPGDDVRIVAPGSYLITLDGSAEVSSLSMGATNGFQSLQVGAAARLTLNNPSVLGTNASLRLLGTLAGDGDLTLRGASNVWASGTMWGAGTTFLVAGAAMTLSTTNNHDLQGRSFSNDGSILWSGGRLRAGGGASVVNTRNWVADLPGEVAIAGDFPGESHFRNSGVFTLNAGTADIAMASECSGNFALKTNTSLQFLGSHQFQSCSFQGGGVTHWKGKIFSCDGTITADNLALESGSCGGDWTLAGRMDWVNGDMNSRGQLTIAAGAVLNIVGAANDHDFAQHVLLVNGTVVHSGGRVRGGSGSTIINAGTWLEQADVDFQRGLGGAVCVFENRGTFRKTGGTGTSTFGSGFQFRNPGVATIEQGSLMLAGGGSSTGGFSVSAGSSLLLASSYDCLPGTKLDGAGTARFQSGVILFHGIVEAQNVTLEGASLAGTNVFSSRLNWVSGALIDPGSTTIAAGGRLNISSTNFHDLPGHALLNLGTISWTDGAIRNGQGSRLENRGLMQAAPAGSELSLASDLGGTFSFANNGTLELLKGTLNVNVPGESAGTFSVASNAVLNFPTDHRFRGGTAFLGSGGITRLNGGGYDLAGAITSENLELTAGKFTGIWTLSGSASWRSGLLDKAGQLTILSGATLQISTASPHDISGATLISQGTLLWTDGAIRNGLGARFENRGLLLIKPTAADLSLNGGLGGQSSFANLGTVNLQSGNLTLDLPGESAGVFKSASNSTLLFPSDHRFSAGSAFLGGGVTRLSGGNYQLSGAISSDNLELAAGSFSGLWVLAGTASWRGGLIDELCQITILAASTLQIGGAANHDLAGGTLINQGTLLWTGGPLRTGADSMIDNRRLFRAQLPGELALNADFGGASVLINSGELDVESGILDLTVVGDASGKYQVAAAATLNILADHRFRSGAKVSGPGITILGGGSSVIEGSLLADNLRLKSGSLGGSGTLSGAVDWAGTRLDGPGTFVIDSGSSLAISTAADHDLPQRTLINNGTVTHTGGNLRGGNGTLITNNGTWLEQSNQSFNYDFAGAYSAFDNPGTFRKQSSTGTTTFNAGFVLRNAGSVFLDTGALQLGDAYVQRSGLTRLSNTTLSSGATVQIQAGSLEGTGTIRAPLRVAGTFSPGSPTGLMTLMGNYVQASSGRMNLTLAGDPVSKNYSRVQITGTATLAGVLNVAFDAGFTPAAQAAYPVLTFASVGGQFTSFLYPNAQTTLQPTFSSTAYTITVTKGGVIAPKVSLVNVTASGAALSWSSGAGTKYHLQYVPEVNLTGWTDIGSDITAQSTTTTTLDPTKPIPAKRFYRVRVVP